MSKASPQKISIRNNLLDERVARVQPVRITLKEGLDVELRVPTGAQYDRMMQRKHADHEFNVQTAMELLYVPGTDEHVFDEADRDVLMQLSPTTPWLGETNIKAAELLRECSKVGKLFGVKDGSEAGSPSQRKSADAPSQS